MTIEHIDKIARDKQRGALYLEFQAGEEEEDFDWRQSSARNEITAWLDHKGIGWEPCGKVCNPNRIEGYEGAIYIDLALDEDCPKYQALVEFLGDDGGETRFPGVRFIFVTLNLAMKNSHHDAPGFWEAWAENF